MATATLLAAALAALVAAAPQPSNNRTTYLALGDSITWGCGTDQAPGAYPLCPPDAGGYRVPLIWALEQDGRAVTTMGTLTSGPANLPAAWMKHEGLPGARIDQIDGLLNLSFASHPDPPTLITIHLGTNDCGQGTNLTNITEVMVARMASLLTHVQQHAPRAEVFLASVIGNTPRY